MAPSSRAALLHWDSSKLPLFVHDADRIAVHRVAGSTMIYSMSQYYEKIISSGDSVIFVFLVLLHRLSLEFLDYQPPASPRRLFGLCCCWPRAAASPLRQSHLIGSISIRQTEANGARGQKAEGGSCKAAVNKDAAIQSQDAEGGGQRHESSVPLVPTSAWRRRTRPAAASCHARTDRVGCS